MSRFDEVAQYWDEDPGRKKMAKAISDAMEQAADCKEKDLLELGCGTGLVGLSLALQAHSLLGIDSSAGMVEVFNQKARSIGLKQARAEQRDIFTDHFEPVDVIFSSMVMHHIQDTGAAIQRCYELLKPGGLFLMADLDKEDGTFHPQGIEGVFHFGFDQAHIHKLLTQAGFKNVLFSTPYTITRDSGKSYPLFLCKAEKISG